MLRRLSPSLLATLLTFIFFVISSPPATAFIVRRRHINRSPETTKLQSQKMSTIQKVVSNTIVGLGLLGWIGPSFDDFSNNYAALAAEKSSSKVIVETATKSKTGESSSSNSNTNAGKLVEEIAIENTSKKIVAAKARIAQIKEAIKSGKENVKILKNDIKQLEKDMNNVNRKLQRAKDSDAREVIADEKSLIEKDLAKVFFKYYFIII